MGTIADVKVGRASWFWRGATFGIGAVVGSIVLIAVLVAASMPRADDARRGAEAALAVTEAHAQVIVARAVADDAPSDKSRRALVTAEADYGVAVILYHEASNPGGPTAYYVLDVVDGDTLTVVDSGGVRTRVRLGNLDAPELDQPGGRAARDVLTAKCYGKIVTLQPRARDRYGRLVADVNPIY